MKPLTVGETARLTGVSVRTLHYYDEIGLLRTSGTSEGGYRLYDEACLARLQQILFFRELAFPLDEIRRILESPSFNSRKAMERHRELLAMKRERLERLIELVDHILKGDITMDFKPFDASEFCRAQERYAEEAKERWGDSPAYAQSAKKDGRIHQRRLGKDPRGDAGGLRRLCLLHGGGARFASRAGAGGAVAIADYTLFL